jgi:hypothetical protein
VRSTGRTPTFVGEDKRRVTLLHAQDTYQSSSYRLLSSHTLIYRHPLYPSLCRRENMDPTSRWVFALLCQSPEPIPPHRSLSTLLPSIYPHATRPYLCPPLSQLCIIPPQPPQNHQPLFHESLGLHRCQLPVPTQVGKCGWLLGWAW